MRMIEKSFSHDNTFQLSPSRFIGFLTSSEKCDDGFDERIERLRGGDTGKRIVSDVHATGNDDDRRLSSIVLLEVSSLTLRFPVTIVLYEIASEDSYHVKEFCHDRMPIT